MEIIKTEALSFYYPGCGSAALSDISITAERGEFIVVAGSSGSGKSTLLRMLKPSLTPNGTVSGKVLYNGNDISALELCDECKIGFVMQSPEAQIVTDKVWHELAFGLESLSVPSNEIRSRVAEMAAFFGIEDWFHKSTSELSGGQKQLLTLASVMVMHPELLLLDEPTAQLDPIAADSFLEMLAKINRELGTTMILAEHRLETAVPLCDRLIIMSDSSVLADGSPREVGAALKEQHSPMLGAMPVPMRVYYSMQDGADAPVTIREGREWLMHKEVNKGKSFHEHERHDAPAAVTLKDVWFRYDKRQSDVLRGVSTEIRRGEIYAMLGGNGAGKTTLISVISGTLAPYRGKASVSGKAIMLLQEPAMLFTHKTVQLELDGITKNKDKTDKIIDFCGLKELLERHPYDLSGGEQEKLALAVVLLTEPDILLLDEPTKGLDAGFKAELGALLMQLAESGVTIIMVSHDIEFCARYTSRCGMLFDGRIVSENSPRAFFAEKSFYTTAASRMARGMIPGAVVAEDITAACKIVNPTSQPSDTTPKKILKRDGASAHSTAAPKPKKTLTKRTRLAAVLSLLLIPLTIFFGVYYLGDRRYYFISLLIILEALLPFLLVFEGRKPRARELVLISVLCAITVVSRSAFFMVPQIKPALALIIISGASLGGETGFLIGAVSAFISNFFFGQGPWTPWQIFAFGIVGLLSGLIFRKSSPKRLPLCIFGVIAALIYGGIMNPAAVIMSGSEPTPAAILSAYALGLPFDLLHALSTVIFLWLIAKPATEKLEHVKKKYGIM